MAYTVKQVAAMSRVSVRTLHFYDETGLLKPAHLGANGYRFYEEPQLLRLQQILFYRELGFELKQIKRILGRRNFEIAAALRSHRKALENNLTRTQLLIGTIDKTIKHLKGTKKMKTEEMFSGFSVAAGADRFNKRVTLGAESVDCKVSGRDTHGAMCAFETTLGGGPLHLHHDQDEWIYVVDGEVAVKVGEKRLRIAAGESVFIPRKVAHVWGPVEEQPSKIINVYQPAGKIEEFFKVLAQFKNLPSGEQVINKTYTEEQVDRMCRLFQTHGAYCLSVVVAITKGQLDLGPWEQIFYGEFDGNRRKRVLVKIIGE